MFGLADTNRHLFLLEDEVSFHSMAGIAISCSQVTRLRASSNQGKRGSRLSELVKASQTEILDSHTEISEAIAAEDGVVNILAQEIGGNFFAAPITVACVFVLMSCMQVVLATVLHSYGHVHPVSFVKMICSTLFLNIVAFLLVLLMSRAVQSDDLILAVAKLDAFVKDCGKGLDWRTVARREYKLSLALWTLAVLGFLAFQFVESWKIELGSRDDQVLDSQQTGRETPTRFPHPSALAPLLFCSALPFPSRFHCVPRNQSEVFKVGEDFVSCHFGDGLPCFRRRHSHHHQWGALPA